MPTSEINNVSPIMRAVLHVMPKSVLDLGIGCGKYGALCREYLDMYDGRIERSQWQTRIFGVEGWEKYHNPMWDLYTEVCVGDFTDPKLYPQYVDYDMVLLIDSLEHLPKELGTDLLKALIWHNSHVIVSCPFGVNYLEQDAVFGNEFERHRAHWKPQDFVNMGGQIVHMGVCVVAFFKGQAINAR